MQEKSDISIQFLWMLHHRVQHKLLNVRRWRTQKNKANNTLCLNVKWGFEAATRRWLIKFLAIMRWHSCFFPKQHHGQINHYSSRVQGNSAVIKQLLFLIGHLHFIDVGLGGAEEQTPSCRHRGYQRKMQKLCAIQYRSSYIT